MADKMNSAALVGCTGLVGSHILTTLTTLEPHPTIHAIARKPLPPSITAQNLKPLIEPDSSKWSAAIKALSPPPSAFLSALGTTRAAAGSFEAQRAIDYDLNLSLARAAKESGIKIYVLISGTGASPTSIFPYVKMKGEIEEAVKALKFPHTVIVRPGLLLGERQDSRPPEYAFRVVAKYMGGISKGLTDFWAQDAGVVGKAAVSAAMQCTEGKREEGVWILSQSEIVRLGRTEW